MMMSTQKRLLMNTAASLIALVGVHGSLWASESNNDSVKIIEPNQQIKSADAAAIDTEKFELGVFTGLLSVEDFDTNRVTGFNFTYHINSDFTASLQRAESEVGRATFEDVVGGDFLSKDDETFKYLSLVGGYRLFHGRSFAGERSKFNSNIYLLFGFSQIEFAGNDESGMILGTSYKTVLTDWLTWDLTFKDHIYERDFLGDKKRTHNVELSLGLNVLF